MGCLHEREKTLIRGGYYVEVSVYDGKRVLWEMVDDSVVEEGREHEED